MRKAFFIILMAVIMAVCFTAPVMGGTTPAYSEPFHTWRTAVTIDQAGQEVSQSATIDGWDDLIIMGNSFDNLQPGTVAINNQGIAQSVRSLGATPYRRYS